MAVHDEIQYAKIDELSLDPLNPRLGRNVAGPKLAQERILDAMSDWNLDELAVSFLESGFWPQEALVVIKEKLYGEDSLVVIEGNRRLAALMYLEQAINGKAKSALWRDIAHSGKPRPKLFERIPYIIVDSREDIRAFLGFRHVTGIQEWNPAEKAQYIAQLIEKGEMTYEQVMRKIGSKTPTVRQNYITYRLLLQMEGDEEISVEHVEEKFSVLYLSLRTNGVRKYLQVDIEAEPGAARRPVPRARLDALRHFALWLFGDKKNPPIVRDSRQVDQFGTILESKKAVEYLESSARPSYDVAFRISGGDEPHLVNLIEMAAGNIEEALSRAHLHTSSKRLQSAVERAYLGVGRLADLFPAVRARTAKEMKE
jgi:ParB-like chromosome segregation protein Spo0J